MGENSSPLTAFVSFPSPCTQTLLLQALVSSIPSLAISLVPPEEDTPPRLQWADYDLMTFDKPHADPSYLISSYIYRKALIRKHQLHLTIIEYLAKCQHRGIESILSQQHGGWPLGWNVEIQFADELDEMWVDELYELGEALQANEGVNEADKRWFILKPGFADRAQGIRLFSSQDGLYVNSACSQLMKRQEIFESFEPESDDEYDEERPEDEMGMYKAMRKSADEAINAMRKDMGRASLDSSDEEESEEEETGTGVMTSQLRHFVIQEYVPRPLLFDIGQQAHDPESAITGFKFHLRAYVLLTGAWTVHLSRTMLALFAGSPYSPPTGGNGEMDLRPHLTNTCLQTDAFGAPTPPEELVKLFWELKGLNALQSTSSGYENAGAITDDWLDQTFAKVGEVVAESVKAGVECGSFGLQLMPNAFEIFGVDLLLSLPESKTSLTGTAPLPTPRVTLLEYNASPDFHQSGSRLRGELLAMFKGVTEISIKPFFGLHEEEVAPEQQIGDQRYGWRLVGKGEIRGPP